MKLSQNMYIRCTSIESFLRVILNRQDKDNKSIHLYFRGESNYHKFVIPNLYKEEDLTLKSSEYYYRSLLSQLGRDEYDTSSSLFRQISELQHYGAKTRILDITSNPLVALFFAVENHYDKENDDCFPGFVYIYQSSRRKEKFDTGHTVAIKSALSLMPQKNINDFLSTCDELKDKCDRGLMSAKNWDSLKVFHKDNIYQDGYSKKPHYFSSDDCNSIRRFMESLNQRAKTHEELVYPFIIYEDLNKSHIVIPSKCTDRIKQQQGAFIFPKYVNTKGKTMNEIKKEIDESVSSLSANIVLPKRSTPVSVIKIPGEKKLEIKKDLEQLGITEGFIYPEIKHRSNTLLGL